LRALAHAVDEPDEFLSPSGVRIPANADSDSDRLRTAFRSIADSVPMIADSSSHRQL
jgi:hypothetical protein